MKWKLKWVIQRVSETELALWKDKQEWKTLEQTIKPRKASIYKDWSNKGNIATETNKNERVIR